MAFRRLSAVLLLLFALLTGVVHAQGPQQTTTDVTTTFVTTIPVPLPAGAVRHTSTSIATTTLTTVIPVLATAAANASATATAPAPDPSADAPVLLDTHVDPAFGVLGAILVLTGLPSAFWGHKNRWSSFFIIGFYTMSLVTAALILKFGVLTAINPPSTTLRGLFVLSCFVAGVAGGGVAIFFWKGAKYFIGAWGGFSLALWIQCLHSGGLIQPIGFRWIFYIGLGTVGFVACTIPKWHWQVLMLSTAWVGATAFILGVDCWASSGLKEFYVYNLGFSSLFPKFDGTGVPFQLTQVEQILLGMIVATAAMGMAVQVRIFVVLKRKLKEIGEEERRREAELETRAAERFTSVQKDLEQWEKEHGRQPSGLSGVPLLSSDPGESTPLTLGRNSSQFSLPPPLGRNRQSGMSTTPTAVGESPDPSKRQNPGALPALDLGYGIVDTIPSDFVAEEEVARGNAVAADLQEKSDLLAEIQTIRRSIDALRSTAGTPHSSLAFGEDFRPRSRLQSFSTSLNGETAFDTYGSRGTANRPRVHSMGMYTSEPSATAPFRHVRTHSTPMVPANRASVAEEHGQLLSHPTSTPLGDNWDTYSRDRRLFTPPTGITEPISPSPIPLAEPAPRRKSLLAVPAAVTDALLRRQKRESTFLETGTVEPEESEAGRALYGRDSILPRNLDNSSSDAVGLSSGQRRKPAAARSPDVDATAAAAPVRILPPVRKTGTPEAAAAPVPRAHTFEELSARHRDKMRTMQAPLSRAEQEQAELDAARSRWERSKNIERDVMARRETEARERFAREEKERGRQKKAERSSPERGAPKPRSASADKLGSSRRMSSALKVQEWQRAQGDDMQQSGSHGRRESKALLSSPIEPAKPASPTTAEKRRSKTTDMFMRGMRRDPPS